MRLTREQMLAEMGLAPLWRLRDAAEAVPEFAQPGQEEAARENSEMPSAVAVVPPHVPTAMPSRTASAGTVSQAASLTTSAPTAAEMSAVATLTWPQLQETVASCRACALCQQRKQAVLGVGDLRADWLFIGEGPGAEEDVQGEPFVGQAGKLLDNMLSALDIARGENVYIANAVKCRPPGNRTPEAAEMAACRPYLARQIALIQPKIIVLLGKAAVHSVLHEDKTLGSMRGQRHDYEGIPVVVTYHPAYLLRNLPEKAKAWDDLLFARRLLRASGKA